MPTRSRKRKATKAIQYTDGKVTRIEPATKNVKVKLTQPSSGGISLSLIMDIAEENN